MTRNDGHRLTDFGDDTLITRLGIVVTEVTSTRVVGTMPVLGNTQPQGLLHGGASAALAETLGSLGAYAHAGDEQVAFGVDLNITHHRSAREGNVTGIAAAIHLGRTVASYAIEIRDEREEIIATARLTCAIRPRRAT
jgi:1,4-dihydroxy-2-naphthoyl-CoA hydrolase